MSGRVLIGGDGPWSGGVVSDLAECVLAPNPSAWTLDGTNTWIVGEALGPCAIIDPGPLGSGHKAAIEETVERRSSEPLGIFLTHGHIDHAEGASELAHRFGVPLYAWDARSAEETSVGVSRFRNGDRFEVNGADVRVLPTPGHSSDSVCFVVGTMIITGDTILGRGTTLVAHPDGRLDEYLESLQTLARACKDQGIAQLLPGHGPLLDEPEAVVQAYLQHRFDRLEEVSAAMKAGAVTDEEIVDRVYRDIPPEVRPAALATVRAQIQYLQES